MTGGALCLDFANTLSWRRGKSPIERLKNYDELLGFGLQAKIIDAAQQRELQRVAIMHPRGAARAFKEALELRSLIDRIFTNIVKGEAAHRQDLTALSAHVTAVANRMRLTQESRNYKWRDIGSALDRLLVPVVRSAADVLTSDRIETLGRCDGPDCGWLFLDVSRTRQRRWCDMRVCGNRAKARRHYHRQTEIGSAN